MFAQEPEQTQFDLRFRLFGISVRVHPLFWLISLIFGWPTFEEGGLTFLIIWVACVFVSILIHEMGHVIVGQLFGSYGHIVLYSFGGLAIGSADSRSHWKRIAVSLAGPAAQLILYGLLYFLTLATVPASLPLRFALSALLYINLYWALLNLLPIYPLDGGQITRDLFSWFSPRTGSKAAFIVSIAAAGFIAVNFLLAQRGNPLIPILGKGSTYLILFFAYLAVNSFLILRQEMDRNRWIDSHRYDYEDERDSWRGGR